MNKKQNLSILAASLRQCLRDEYPGCPSQEYDNGSVSVPKKLLTQALRAVNRMAGLAERLREWRDRIEPLDEEGFHYGQVEINTLNDVLEILEKEDITQ